MLERDERKLVERRHDAGGNSSKNLDNCIEKRKSGKSIYLVSKRLLTELDTEALVLRRV